MTASGYRAIVDDEPQPIGAAARAFVSGTFAICRWNLKTLCRQWIFWGIFALGMLHFLLHFAMIYIKAQIDVQQPAFKDFVASYLVTGSGKAYRDFLATQSRAVMLLLTYAGVISVVGDFRAGGMIFYLSKPIGKLEYIFGKTLALAGVTALLTLVPGLILYLEFGLFSDSLDYWRQNPRIAWGIVCYSLLIASVLSLLVVALGTWCRRGTPFVMAWTAIFVVLPIVGELMGSVFKRVEVFRLMNLWLDLRMIADRAFGHTIYRNPAAMPQIGLASMVLLGIVVVSVVVLLRKLRAVEIVD